MENPKVSVIISAFNAELYIFKTIQSVLEQTWNNIEIIVVDDGSTDGTLLCAKKFESKGVIVLSQKNRGQDAALNNGYKYSNGEYIKFLDSDDLINPEMIKKQMDVIGGWEDYVAYGEWDRFYDDRPQDAQFTHLSYWRDMHPVDFLTAMPNGVMLQCGIMLIPRKLIEKAGLWDERLILFNDTEFFNRIILASAGIKFSKDARLYYRSGMPGSISAGKAKKFYESTYLATNLIAGQLLAVEDSERTRRLISNTFLMQYYHMYPKYPDLQKMHVDRIEHYGCGTYKIEGGMAFKILASLLGWKIAKKIQSFTYRYGYLTLLNWFRRKV